MLVRQMLEIYDLLDTPQASGEAVAALLRERGAQDVTVTVVGGNQGTTDCVKVVIPGRHGKSTGGDAPTLGIVGRLGGIGARPEMIGQVSDGDGALAALTVALKLAEMHHNDDILEGDVIIGTHVCPDAPTIPHEPVPFMDSPIDMAAMNEQEVDARMDAVLSIDTTKGKVETMMDTIVQAFDKQLDALFGAEAMDISTDITVMENLLAQEGLSGKDKTASPDGRTTLEL